jgi:hypothetical protein
MAVIVATVGAGTASAEPAGIVVRTFNNYRVAADDLREARVHASDILSAAGITVTWIDCWHGDKPAVDAPARCAEPVGSDLVLRLQRAPEARGDQFVSLGFSLVTLKAGPLPFLATVYADLAEGVARRAGVGSRPVLGRAIAHEIGHLLLNVNDHPREGVMRAAWSQAELRRTSHSKDWAFLEPEVAAMHAAIARRP